MSNAITHILKNKGVHVEGNGPYSQIDNFTAETEVLHFLYSLVRLIKPLRILETGTYHGYSAIWMGQACRENRVGRIDSIEKDRDMVRIAQKNICKVGLDKQISLWHRDALDFAKLLGQFKLVEKYGLAFLDSDPALRLQEFNAFKPFMDTNAFFVFHDSHSQEVRDQLAKINNTAGWMDFPTGRGLAICQMSKF
jgi:predicted O-methyltransferase YrrM